MKKDVLEQFMSGLADDVENVIIENLDMNAFSKDSNIILLRTVNCERFYSFVDKLRKNNPKQNIYILGDSRDLSYIGQYDIPTDNLVKHEGVIDVKDVKKLTQSVPINECKSVIFFTNEVYSYKYLNIIQYLNELQKQANIRIYGFLIDEKKAIQYVNIDFFLTTIELVKPLFNWIKSNRKGLDI